jgi:hypothetical protein
MRVILAVAAAVFATVSLLPAQAQTQQHPFTFDKNALRLLKESEALDRQFEKRALVYHDSELQKYLEALSVPLLPKDPLEHVQWKFRILRDPAVNAFGLPNGSIYLNTGLLARAENDDQVFARLAHEISHVTNRDPYLFNRTLRKKVVETEVFEGAAGALFGLSGFYATRHVSGQPDQIGLIAAVTGYPQTFEQKSDENAVRRLRLAGRNPAQLVRLSLLINRLELEPVSFWKNQSNIEDRIAYEKALVGLDRGPDGVSDPGYVARMKSLILDDIHLDLDMRRYRSAVAAAERLVDAYPNDAIAVFWLAESYRSLGPRLEGIRTTYQQFTKFTDEDEANRLAGTPQGKAALDANQKKSEELYKKAASLDPALAEPYFGLGSLYQQQGKKGQAADMYRKYVDLSQRPADKERAKYRLAELTKTLGEVK